MTGICRLRKGTSVNDLFSALINPNIVFLRYAFIIGILASVAFGIMGSFVVARRISYIAGSISHSILGGLGAALYFQRAHHMSWFHPIFGAVAAALLSALIIGFVSIYARQREDTVIGAIWSIGMATGLLFLAKTPGYVDPMSYLFGNILLISQTDLILVVALDVLILAIVLFFYNKLLAVCFDEEFARLRGIRVDFYYLLMLCLVALTIVLLVTVVGIVLVIAMLTLPAAIASQFSNRLSQMMVLAVIICTVFTTLGLSVSYYTDLPGGPVIISVLGAAYLFILGFLKLKSALRFKHTQ